MRLHRTIYVLAVFLAGAGSTAASIASQETGIFVLLFFQGMIAVLSYPAGFAAALLGGILLFSGLVNTPEEILLMTPLYALLGYLQWFWLLPKIYGRKANSGSGAFSPGPDGDGN